MKPKISIIVPVYKVESYLKRCIDSIINQSYKNLEIILINDGSPDNCGQICDDYTEKDTRIIVIHQENTGQSGARNKGLKKATGDYIGFVDSDDWIEPNMYEFMLDVLIENNADVVECGVLKTKKVNKDINRDGIIKKPKKLEVLKRIIKNQDFNVWNRLFPRHVLENILFMEGKMSEDVYFTWDYLKNINNYIYVSNPFYNYYMSNESITRGTYSLKVLDTIDSALYIQSEVSKVNNKELTKITSNFVLDVLLLNYKLLNQNDELDPSFLKRKEIKNLIKKNDSNNVKSSVQVKLARYLPVASFNVLLKRYTRLRCQE